MSLSLRHRPRRLRTRAAVRDLVREHLVTPSDLVQPLFVQAGEGPDEAIASMPGQARLSEPRLVEEAARAWAAGVRAVALFPRIDDALKTEDGREAWNPEGLIPRIVRRLHAEVPGLAVIGDVALDPYSSLGQDGIVVDGEIANDLTVEGLVRQARCQAEAGVDVVAPSDMMDGRVGAIRDALDADGHTDTLILAYSAKYASAFYGPFRDALDSAPRGGGDKRTYQMDPGNGDEALHEVGLDLDEGADIVMVKPGLPYLDVLWRLKEAYGRPMAVYQVSGEYAMLEAAGRNGWIDRDACIRETLLSFKRAGADLILTYHATEAAERLLTRW
ncbi:MAG: porphobilinogen synthase [Alphaproteobacteria bacterium]|nr:porphobilinogen synthase [Alphaproteobacteria bacterium]